MHFYEVQKLFGQSDLEVNIIQVDGNYADRYSYTVDVDELLSIIDQGEF